MADAGGTACEVEVFPEQAEEFVFLQSGVQGEFEQNLWPVAAARNWRASSAVRDLKRRGRGHADVADNVAADLLNASGVLRGGF
ncbi:hypothetical protein [Kitasatospora cystarginea]|uniref:hypothetical protein n=1 Tax=Kitasatospora cystarginea TaxID=58350 RepID=UPI0031DA0163